MFTTTKPISNIVIKHIPPLLNYLCESYIDFIAPLWEESHQHHIMKSTYFREYYSNYSFDNFKSNLIRNYDELMFFFVYENTEEPKQPIGCCFVGLHFNSTSAILGNVIVTKEHRKKYIGSQLIQYVEATLLAMNKTLHIEVSYGNDVAVEFYKSLGYYPKNISMVKR